MERKFDFVEVTLEPENYELIKEVYRLHKEQANKLFDLGSGIKTNEDIMERVENYINNGIVLLGIDIKTKEYAGCIILQNIMVYDNTIVRTTCHLVVNKKYWGKNSRELILNFYEYIKENMKPVNRLEAIVPANNYGIIKLLKDVGFRVEGTLKKRLLLKNKNNEPQYYDELIYSNTNLGE